MAAARDAGVQRTVYTSTTFAIGEAKGEVGNESTRHRGHFYAAYEEAKYRAEQVVLEFAHAGLPVVIVNPAGVYGPGGVGPTGESLVSAINGRLSMAMHGVFSLVYVDDVVEGHLRAEDRGRIGERYILSATQIDAVDLLREVCRLAGVKPPPVGPLWVGRVAAFLGEGIARLTGRRPQVARDTIALLSHGSRLDGSKAARELGLHYTPLEEGLIKTLAWYWEQGLLKQKPQCLN
jgi:dihydroflavonol-4-reductase